MQQRHRTVFMRRIRDKIVPIAATIKGVPQPKVVRQLVRRNTRPKPFHVFAVPG